MPSLLPNLLKPRSFRIASRRMRRHIEETMEEARIGTELGALFVLLSPLIVAWLIACFMSIDE